MRVAAADWQREAPPIAMSAPLLPPSPNDGNKNEPLLQQPPAELAKRLLFSSTHWELCLTRHIYLELSLLMRYVLLASKMGK